MFAISMGNRTRGQRYNLYKKQTGNLKKRFFSARVENPWNELDKKTVGQIQGKAERIRILGHGSGCHSKLLLYYVKGKWTIK